jgi:hypothetical protein
MPAPDLLAVALASLVGSALAVWGVVRLELRGLRDEVSRAHWRLDQLGTWLPAAAAP